MNSVPFSVLLGQTLSKVEGLTAGNDEVVFITESGASFKMLHYQSCCETVEINDVEGDVQDLIGLPLVVCEEVDSTAFPAPASADSYTWTFYRLATAKGFVVIRWLGESNGYYGESVDFEQLE